jgi:hypothetical protein
MFRKSFDKMGTISPRAQKIIIALHETVAALPAASEKGKEVSAADLLAVLSKCEEAKTAVEAVNELKGLGAIIMAKGAPQPADKDNPLSAFQFFVDPAAFEKYFLYCSYKDMVTMV